MLQPRERPPNQSKKPDFFSFDLWHSDRATAERGNEMHFAILAYGVQYASSCDFPVDGDRDRRPDVSIFEELSIEAWKALAEMTNHLANRFCRDVNALDAAGKFA
jgi:hypothetical protein